MSCTSALCSTSDALSPFRFAPATHAGSGTEGEEEGLNARHKCRPQMGRFGKPLAGVNVRRQRGESCTDLPSAML